MIVERLSTAGRVKLWAWAAGWAAMSSSSTCHTRQQPPTRTFTFWWLQRCSCILFSLFFAEIKKLSPHKKLTKSRGNICESFYGGDDGGLFNMHSVCLMEIWLKPWRKQATKATLTHTHTQKGRASTAAADRKAKRTRQDYAKARQKLFDVWTPREINWQHKTKSSARAWDWEKGKGRENRRKNWKNRIAGKQIKRPAAIYWCSAHAPPTSSVLQFCSSFPRELGKIF